jgi:hypothetical protein
VRYTKYSDRTRLSLSTRTRIESVLAKRPPAGLRTNNPGPTATTFADRWVKGAPSATFPNGPMSISRKIDGLIVDESAVVLPDAALSGRPEQAQSARRIPTKRRSNRRATRNLVESEHDPE